MGRSPIRNGILDIVNIYYTEKKNNFNIMDLRGNYPNLNYEFHAEPDRPKLKKLDHTSPKTLKLIDEAARVLEEDKRQCIKRFLGTDNYFQGSILDGSVINMSENDAEELFKRQLQLA